MNGPGSVRATFEVGAALELLQTYLLIHDDWMDEDDERRGQEIIQKLTDQHIKEIDGLVEKKEADLMEI